MDQFTFMILPLVKKCQTVTWGLHETENETIPSCHGLEPIKCREKQNQLKYPIDLPYREMLVFPVKTAKQEKWYVYGMVMFSTVEEILPRFVCLKGDSASIQASKRYTISQSLLDCKTVVQILWQS